jgi:FkbM family methyltransferase
VSEIRIRNACFSVVDGPQTPFWGRVSSGHWEPGTFAAIESRLTPETTVLDFGAWIGPVTLFAASHAKAVISFEPDPVAAKELKANIALNPSLAPKITVMERAVWSETGTVQLGAKTAQGDSMSSVHHKGSAVSWSVETITPAEIAGLLPPDGPVFIKIDTEGAEYAIVPVLAPLLARKNVAALVSFHPRFAAGNHPRFHKTFPMTRRVFDVFKGFRVHRVHHARLARAPVIETLNRFGMAWFEAKTSYLFTR